MIRTLKVEIDEQAKMVHVTEYEDGVEVNSYLLESFAAFGGDARNKELFIRMFGASADAAWAYGQGFMISRSPSGGKALKNFYKQSAAHMCQIIDPNAFRNEVGAEEVLNRWEDPDQQHWFGQDTEDVLEDKQKSEARKKAIANMIAPDAPADPKKWN